MEEGRVASAAKKVIRMERRERRQEGAGLATKAGGREESLLLRRR